MKYYKWFADKKPIYGRGEYVLDGGWQPRIEGKLIPCERGYHVCTEGQLPCWRGTDLAEVEIDEEGMAAVAEKTVVRSFRIVRWLSWSRSDMVDCARVDAVSCASYSAACGAASASASVRAAVVVASSAAAARDAAAGAAERDRQRDWILNRAKENERLKNEEG